MRIAPGAGDLGDEALEEVAPVGKLRQFVGGGEPFQVFRFGLQLAHFGRVRLDPFFERLRVAAQFGGQVGQFLRGLEADLLVRRDLARVEVEEIANLAHVAGHLFEDAVERLLASG